jgi:hypothetical protein
MIIINVALSSCIVLSVKKTLEELMVITIIIL